MPARTVWRRELRPLLALAGPVVLAEIGWMAMGVVDTLMVGPLGPVAIGAVSVGTGLFNVVGIFGIGLLLGLDTLVSQAHGAGHDEDARHSLRQAVYLSLLLGPLLATLILLLLALLPRFGVQPDVRAAAGPYLQALVWSVVPLLFYGAFRRYLQGVGRPGVVMFALLSANVVNAGGNWLLVYGNWGLPRLGVAGSGWATCLARLYMALVLLLAIIWPEPRTLGGLLRGVPHIGLRVDLPRIRNLLRLGLPAAGQIALEIGVFSAATLLASRLAPIALAAHQIALNLAALTYMVPLGVASAGAVRVGHAIGRRDPSGAQQAGWLAIGLGAGFMLCAGIVFAAAPRALLQGFTKDAQVLTLGTALLLVAAVFQLFDGLQTVTTGVLRGAGDTRTPMLTNLLGHWVMGLPLGYLLCFRAGWGVIGLWIGLSLGLFIVGMALLFVWSRRARVLQR